MVEKRLVKSSKKIEKRHPEIRMVTKLPLYSGIIINLKQKNMTYLLEIKGENGYELHVTNDSEIANRVTIIEKSNDEEYIYLLKQQFDNA